MYVLPCIVRCELYVIVKCCCFVISMSNLSAIEKNIVGVKTQRERKGKEDLSFPRNQPCLKTLQVTLAHRLQYNELQASSLWKFAL